ncbi:hypothetical protein COBT_000544 [Conglomerata obtusa]
MTVILICMIMESIVYAEINVEPETLANSYLKSTIFDSLTSNMKKISDSPEHGDVAALYNQNADIKFIALPNPQTNCYYTCNTTMPPGTNPTQPGYQPQQTPSPQPSTPPQQNQPVSAAPPTQQQTPKQVPTQNQPPAQQPNANKPYSPGTSPASPPNNANTPASKPVVCENKQEKTQQMIRELTTPNFSLTPNAIKRTTTVTVTKQDSESPIQKIKDIDPELGKQIEKILDYNGITEPWSAYEDLASPKQHQMPDWCNMYKKVRSMFKVFESLKELISEEFSNIQRFMNRGKVYMKEYADELKKYLDRMILDLKKMKVAKDYSTKDEYMRRFNSTHCKTQETIAKYKKLRSWLLNTIKVFSRMFYPFNVNRMM